MNKQEFGNFVNKIIDHCKTVEDCSQCEFKESDYCKIQQYLSSSITNKEKPANWNAPIWATGISDDDKEIMKKYLKIFPTAVTFIRSDTNTYVFKNEYSTTLATLHFNPLSVNVPICYPLNIKHYFLNE